MEASHERVDSESERDEIEEILETTSEAEVVDISTRVWSDSPPAPLNLPWAQQKFPGSPSQVLSNLQTLYNDGHLTYPRTESQDYGDDFDFAEKILALGTGSPISVPDFGGSFDPTSGSKRDPAHPPITPTTNIPHFGDLGKWEKKVYIRVVRHFLATLMDSARKKKTSYTLDVEGREFEVDRKQMVERGYFEVYAPYKRVYDDSLPDWSEGDVLEIDDWEIEKKETSPPDLWSSSEIIEKMEDVDLGTSATRAGMIDKLFSRGYVESSDGLRTNRLGQNVVEALRDHAPRITDPVFTSELQRDLDRVQRGEADREEIVMDAREWVADVCVEIKSSEREIGVGMVRDEDACPECGGTLYYNEGQYGWFWSCENWDDECDYTE